MNKFKKIKRALLYLKDGLSTSPICLQLKPEERMMFNCLLPMPFENRRIGEENQIDEFSTYQQNPVKQRIIK